MNIDSRVAIAMLAMLAFCVGLSAAAEDAAGMTVHEWGTFTTFSGSNGKRMRFTPDAPDLPSFVHRGYEKGGMTMFVSLETPVLYAYTASERKFSVTATFPRGQFTESYPSPDALGTEISWKDVIAKPTLDAALPEDSKRTSDHYFRARETDSALLEKASGSEVEHEKFIFYRGIGNAALPIQLKATTGGNVSVENSYSQALPAAFLIHVISGKMYFKAIGAIAPNTPVASATPAQESREKLGELVVNALVAQGLFEKEARAMVKTWDDSWFQEEGWRLIYLLPAPLTEQLLPLKVDPAPYKLTRVMVGRLEFLTPEQENEIDATASVEKNSLNLPERFYLAAHWAAQARAENATSAASHPSPSHP